MWDSTLSSLSLDVITILFKWANKMIQHTSEQISHWLFFVFLPSISICTWLTHTQRDNTKKYHPSLKASFKVKLELLTTTTWMSSITGTRTLRIHWVFTGIESGVEVGVWEDFVGFVYGCHCCFRAAFVGVGEFGLFVAEGLLSWESMRWWVELSWVKGKRKWNGEEEIDILLGIPLGERKEKRMY